MTWLESAMKAHFDLIAETYANHQFADRLRVIQAKQRGLEHVLQKVPYSEIARHIGGRAARFEEQFTRL